MAKISVIMAVYNEPIEWINESIESILKQTYNNFEFIIVNDNPERTENNMILNQYSHRDNRIRVIKNTKNLGLTKSLNLAIRAAKGDYIARMDADDISLPQRFEKQIKLMEENPDCDYCGTNAIVFSEEKIKGIRKTPRNNKELAGKLFSFNPICHPSIIIRRNSIVYEELYDEECLKSQDYELWLRFLVERKKYIGLSESLIKYRVSDLQISSRQVGVQTEFATLSKIKALRRYLSQIGFYGNSDLKNFIQKIIDSINKKSPVDYVDKSIKFYLYMSKEKTPFETLCIVAKSLLKNNLGFKYILIIFISIFTSRYKGYDISKELNYLEEQIVKPII